MNNEHSDAGASGDPLAGLPPPPVEPPAPSSAIPSVPPPAVAPAVIPPTAATPSPYVSLPPRRRRRGVVIAVAVAIVALLGAAAFAIVTVTGGKSKSGAASPEKAVDDFVAAANDQDVLGMLDALLPTERHTWGDPLVQMLAEAKRLDIASGDADLSSVRGIDLELDVNQGSPEPVAADIDIIPVSGTATANVDFSALPIGSLLADHGVKPEPGTSSQRSSTSRIDGRLATVERDGRWYVSLAYTAAEAARRQAGDLRWPARDGGIGAVGAPSPVAALTQLVDAVQGRSVERVLASLDPEEAEVVQRAAPWFVDDVQSQLDDAVKEHAVTFTFLDPRFSVISQDDDQALVRVEHLGVEIESDGSRFRYDGGCLSTTAPEGQEETHCVAGGTPASQTIDPQLEGTPLADASEALSKLVDDIRSSLKDLAAQGIVVRRVDGEWYVSPIGTGTTSLLSVLAALDRDELDTLITDTGDVVASFLDSIASFGDAVGPETGGSDDFTDDQTDSTDASGPTAIPLDQYFACQGKADYDAVVACVQAGLAAGAFTREMVDGIYLAPECAWRGLRYDASLHDLSDAEYTNRVSISAACFAQQVAAGSITEAQVPFELIHVECLKGKNPSHMTPKERAAYSTCQLDSPDDTSVDENGD
jgi:hypothetical protein